MTGPHRHRLVVEVTADMPVHLRVLHRARLARVRFGHYDQAVFLEMESEGLNTLVGLITAALAELDPDPPTAASPVVPVDLDEEGRTTPS